MRPFFANVDINYAGLVDTSRTAVVSRVVEKFVELISFHMPAFFAGAIIVVGKNKWLRFFPFTADELHTVFTSETDTVHFVDNPQAFKNPIRFRHQRFADMFAGNSVAFDQQN